MDIFSIFKFIMNMKFGWLLWMGFSIIMGGSIIRNIFTGSFSVGKLLGGFNIFTGSVQGKLIYYGLIIFGCFVAYHFIMRPTNSYDTDYKNNIQHNQDVMIDQRVGTNNGCDVNLFFGLIKIGCRQQPITKIVNNDTVCEKCNSKEIKENNPEPKKEVKKLNPFSAPLRWISKLFKK